MPKIFNIVSEKYYNQFTNGLDFSANLSDYTTNVAGNVGEKIKAVIQISIGWNSNSDSFNFWEVSATKIRRFSGSFRDDGFLSGQKFFYVSTWSSDNESPVEFEATITSISSDGLEINFTVDSGVVPTGTQNDAGIWADAEKSANYLTALLWRFGIIDNQADFSNVSNVSGNSCTLIASSIGSGAPRSTAWIDLLPQGIYRDWFSGQARAKFVGDTPTFQTFEIEHEFLLTPFYLEGQLANFQNTVLPDYLEGDNSLKYAYQPEFRLVISNPNTAIDATVDQNLGSVGWFGENFNGLGSNYELISISYKDTLTSEPVVSLQNSRKTTATITISKTGGSLLAGQRAGLILFYLAPQAQYQNTTTRIEENFMLEALYVDEGAASEIGTIITSLSSTINAGDLVVTAEIELSASQASTVSGGYYFIGVQIADSSLSPAQSDREIVFADTAQFSEVSVIDDLIAFDGPKFYYHDDVYGVDAGFSALQAWNEDGFLFELDFELDLSKSAFLNSISFILAAYKVANGSYFELDRYDFETGSAIISSGVQQIWIDKTRNYFLSDNDQFNWAKIETGSLAGNLQAYKMLIGQKVSWQDWIANIGADSVFFDNTKPNNNLNRKSSNYSNGLQGYQIRCIVVANLSGIDDVGNSTAGQSILSSPNMVVYDYSQDGNAPALWTGIIRTFDPNTNADLGGNILSDRDTLFEIEWEYTDPVYSTAVIFCIHRIEVRNDAGTQIHELSNINQYPSGNMLKPLSGETQLQLTTNAGKIYSRCLIDYTKLTASEFNLSGRLQR